MNLEILFISIYIFILIVVLLRIMYETRSSSKALAYVLLCIFVPIFGIVFYLVFGVNYWQKKKYSKKITLNEDVLNHIRKNISLYSEVSVKQTDDALQQNQELSQMLVKDLGSPLTACNSVKVLANGEKKFPDLQDSILLAKHHIHLEYYIYECDETGLAIIELLIQKAKEGVKVRFIYDDFGSPTIKSSLEKRMRDAGIEIFAFHKIVFYLLANRFNYRNHRKILIIDGHTAYMGGINVSDKYVNSNDIKKLFWRDTHIKIVGPAVYYLQYLFVSDWNFCCSDHLLSDIHYFPAIDKQHQNCFVQIAAGGPDSPQPSILYSLLQAIYLAKEEILITTPYFIPGDSILDALSVAAMSGLKVQLLVPGISDSKFVNAASRSYYSKLLEAGVEIYLYKKGFVHAKTMVCDGKLSIIGTANMDHRSFELNFEVNAIVYDQQVAMEMRENFVADIGDAEKINAEEWLSRSWPQQLSEKVARLFSPVM